MTENARRGAIGEEAAVEWLRSNGFMIVDRNWRSGRYELDVVAKCGDTLHFVEVKLRSADGLTAPEDAMTSAKSRTLLRAANLYINEFGVKCDCQIDFIAVDYADGEICGIRYIPNAVNPRW